MDPTHPLITQLDALIEAVSSEIADQVRIAEEAEQHLSQPTPPTGVDVAFLIAPPTVVPALDPRVPGALSADNLRTDPGVDTRVLRPVAIPPVAPAALEPAAPAPVPADPAPVTVLPPAGRLPAGRPRTMREALLA